MNQSIRKVVQDVSQLCAITALAILLMLISANTGFSQQRIQIGFGGLGFDLPDQSSSRDFDVETGAILKTDPDLEDVLKTAERMRNDGQYRVASQLWQAVLKRSGDALYSPDGTTYFSLVQQVEAILAGLPAEALSVYRVLADAEAKEILAQAASATDVIALNKIVRQYFMSSLGDEAAFDLGCIYLDKFDFIGARRMFEKIARHYPDPTVPMDQVHARIALCQSYLGDVESAAVSLDRADLVKPNTQRVDLVRRSLGKLSAGVVHSPVNVDWKMLHGNSRRFGTMQDVSDEMMEGDLAAIWQFYFEPRNKYSRSADVDGKILSGAQASGDGVLETRVATEAKLIQAWREKSWRPAGELLFEGDRVFFKTGADLTVWSRAKIAKASEMDAADATIESAIQWRSIWRNAFEVDSATLMMAAIRKNWGGRRRPGESTSNSPSPTLDVEVNLFGDLIFQQMSIHKNVVFSIEGKSFDDRNKIVTPRVSARWNATFRRTRSNRLTAYDATTGHVKWSLPRESRENSGSPVGVEFDSPWLEGGGFMAAPIGFGDMVLVPVNKGGAIYVYALDPMKEGKTIWRSFLCDEPESGSVPWSAINLSIEGSDLFVSCGMGVVFVLDPATGTVRFAKRYQRVGSRDNFVRRRGWMASRLNFNGWSSDLVIPYGRQMICLCSDTDTIEAFDRNSGELIWRSEMSPVGYKVDYVLGVYNDVLYAAGTETIVAYDLKGEGRMIWGTEQLFDGKQSLGRGVVTPKGIYLPVEDSIYQFDLNGDQGKAKVLAKVHVDLGTAAPVGNLYSDGERFWVHGANRLYALGPKNP